MKNPRPNAEPPVSPPDEDERTQEQIQQDEALKADKAICAFEDKLLDDTPPDNWP